VERYDAVGEFTVLPILQRRALVVGGCSFCDNAARACALLLFCGIPPDRNPPAHTRPRSNPAALAPHPGAPWRLIRRLPRTRRRVPHPRASRQRFRRAHHRRQPLQRVRRPPLDPAAQGAGAAVPRRRRTHCRLLLWLPGALSGKFGRCWQQQSRAVDCMQLQTFKATLTPPTPPLTTPLHHHTHKHTNTRTRS